MSADVQALVESRRDGWSLERPFYTDPELFRADLDRVFFRYWLFVGHVSQVRETGDYFTYEIGDESIIVIRGRDGDVHALFNVCRHRGSRICLEAAGRAKKLVCPYHQWVYDTDGTLIAARHMPEDLDKAASGLHRASVRVMEGLIFISLAEEPLDFDPVVADIQPQLAPHELATAKICHTRTYEIRANWKLIAENFRECYHCPGTHPEYCRAVESAGAYEFGGDADARRRYYENCQVRWKAFGLPIEPVEFSRDRWHHCSRYPFREGFVSETLDGRPAAPLMGRFTEPDMGVFAIVIFPNFWFESSADYAVTIRHTPVSPSLTRTVVNWYVHADAVEGKDYEVENVTAFWRATGEQDWKLCEDNQAGVNSRRYQPGPYSSHESEVNLFVQWYLDQL